MTGNNSLTPKGKPYHHTWWVGSPQDWKSAYQFMLSSTYMGHYKCYKCISQRHLDGISPIWYACSRAWVSDSRPACQLRPAGRYFVAPALIGKFNVIAAREFCVNGTLLRCVWKVPLLRHLELNEPTNHSGVYGFRGLVIGRAHNASRETFHNNNGGARVTPHSHRITTSWTKSMLTTLPRRADLRRGHSASSRPPSCVGAGGMRLGWDLVGGLFASVISETSVLARMYSAASLAAIMS